jgi:endonuclease III related protein
MPPSRLLLSRVVDTLAHYYGEPSAPRITDTFAMVVWENIAYLATDARRAEAFEELRKKVGLRPSDIRKASDKDLLSITSKGIVPQNSLEKLRGAAEIAREFFADDLGSVLTKPVPVAKKDLRRFPSIGEPAAEKILLFNHKLPALALDSNGLRVLVRLGFAPEKKTYAATYKGVQDALAPQLSADCKELVRAHQLLRQHGQELCKRSKPTCARCPLRAECSFFAETPAFPAKSH